MQQIFARTVSDCHTYTSLPSPFFRLVFVLVVPRAVGYVPVSAVCECVCVRVQRDDYSEMPQK